MSPPMAPAPITTNRTMPAFDGHRGAPPKTPLRHVAPFDYMLTCRAAASAKLGAMSVTLASCTNREAPAAFG